MENRGRRVISQPKHINNLKQQNFMNTLSSRVSDSSFTPGDRQTPHVSRVMHQRHFSKFQLQNQRPKFTRGQATRFSPQKHNDPLIAGGGNKVLMQVVPEGINFLQANQWMDPADNQIQFTEGANASPSIGGQFNTFIHHGRIDTERNESYVDRNGDSSISMSNQSMNSNNDSLQPEEYKIVETIYDIDDDEENIFNKPLQDDLVSLDKDIMEIYDPKKGRRNKGSHQK